MKKILLVVSVCVTMHTLKAMDTKVSRFHKAAQEGRVDDITPLLDAGVVVDTTDEAGGTALHFAAMGGHMKVVVLLVARGADVNFADKEGITALHLAAIEGKDLVVSFLLSNGADKKATDSKGGYTALQFAQAGHHEKTVNLLQAAENLE